ncbi:hypothetical protein AVEN_159797-1 [Araneus ventricosus]|uniref:DDE-1 domain-containing protein n=1 Tax=Araneus ventricosus TaxID=182803 RepID=A0A4Y2KJD8_ARAVE|nr:hypothetical protein AVEN_159797-1 [Araneus ventricosus]
MFMSISRFHFSDSLRMAGELNLLWVQDKIKVFKFLDENKLKKKVKIDVYFKIPFSTLSTLIKNRETFGKKLSCRKQEENENSTYPEVEECVRKWFVQCRNQNLPQTIKNCFIKAVFSENKTSSETEGVDSIKQSIEEEINPEQWESIQKDCNTNISFEDFLDVDNEVQTCGTMTDQEIVANINAEISDEEYEELYQEHEKVTVKEAEKAVELLQSFLESIENIGTESFGAIATLEKTVQLQKGSVRQQTAIKDFLFQNY